MKCGVVRKNDVTHHCGRCDRCTDYMDHHCYFSNNCIGRGNIRVFVQFTSWIVFVIFIGLVSIIALFYIQNTQTKRGLRNITEFFTHYCGIIPAIEYIKVNFSEEYRQHAFRSRHAKIVYNDMMLKGQDCHLLLIMAFFCIGIACILTMVLVNIRSQTTKSKRFKDMMRDEAGSKPSTLTMGEVFTHIFGENPSLAYILFPIEKSQRSTKEEKTKSE